MDIYNLFPTAVGKSVRHLTDTEKKFFEELKNTEIVKNAGNSFTKNIHVLDNPILKDLKIDLTDILNNYFQKVIEPIDGIETYITISWVNYTEQGEYHHEHSHPNSIFSGVYYIDADETDKITSIPNELQIKLREYFGNKFFKIGMPTQNTLYHSVLTLVDPHFYCY